MQCSVIHEIDRLRDLLASGGQLNCSVVQGLDLRAVRIEWESLECAGAVFLGCHFPEHVSVQSLMVRGALVFPRLAGLPYDPYRSKLYTRVELMQGWVEGEDNSLDKKIYDHFDTNGRHAADVLESLSQRLHDHAIDDALTDLLEGRVEEGGKKKVVAVMGGHGTPRTDPFFHKVVRITAELTRKGYFIASGGGPGMMEAANLGAWLAKAPDELIDRALGLLSEAPVYTDKGYVEAGQRVLDLHPHGQSSLAVPTWFYGHEPTNQFARHVAKYFSNSIREDGLLAMATYGIIFAPGSAGTTQEIFQDAAQNHYVTFDHISPMVFLGEKRYREETMLFDCLKQLAVGKKYSEYLLCTDEVDKVVEAISSYQLTES